MDPVSDPVRILQEGPATRAWNMAEDEALLRLASAPVLRIYRWTEPAVSIGYFGLSSDVPPGRPFVRRYTGGGLVDHEADFTYSIIVPRVHRLNSMGTQESYEEIHRAVAKTLDILGYASDLAAAASPLENSACFQKPVKFDVVNGSSKLAGAAQRRTREGCLHQGSILLPSFDFEALSEVLIGQLSPLLGFQTVAGCLSAEEKARARVLETERYSTDEWNLSR